MCYVWQMKSVVIMHSININPIKMYIISYLDWSWYVSVCDSEQILKCRKRNMFIRVDLVLWVQKVHFLSIGLNILGLDLWSFIHAFMIHFLEKFNFSAISCLCSWKNAAVQKASSMRLDTDCLSWHFQWLDTHFLHVNSNPNLRMFAWKSVKDMLFRA